MSTREYLNWHPRKRELLHGQLDQVERLDFLFEWHGNPHTTGELPEGLIRGDVFRELEELLDGNVGGGFRCLTDGNYVARNDFGVGKDWGDYENAQGYTTLIWSSFLTTNRLIGGNKQESTFSAPGTTSIVRVHLRSFDLALWR